MILKDLAELIFQRPETLDTLNKREAQNNTKSFQKHSSIMKSHLKRANSYMIQIRNLT
jgi:hypothetical protein